MRQRNLFIELVKSVAIILVVVAHCIQFGSGSYYRDNSLFLDNTLFKFIYSFHMPLFMLISGYLFAFSVNKRTKDILLSKFNHLIVPSLTWSVAPLIIYIINHFDNECFSILYAIKHSLVFSVYSLWFLWAVFGSILIIVIVNRLFNDSIYIYLFIFIMSFFIPDFYNWALCKFMYPFFVIGYFSNKWDFKNKLFKVYNSPFFIWIVGCIFILLMLFYNRDIYIYVSKYSILGKDVINQLYIDLYRFIVALFGCILVVVCLYKIYNKGICNNQLCRLAIITLGRSTMGIYIVSTFINIYILDKLTKSVAGHNFLFVTLESVIIIISSVAITNGIKRHNFLNKYLLGAKIE